MKYFRTLLNEKGISLDTVLEVEGKDCGSFLVSKIIGLTPFFLNSIAVS